MLSQRIKYLVMDVDGTLTDGKIYMSGDGELFKVFDIKDGYCISSILPEHGIEPVIITGRKSQIVKKRCDELNVDMVYQGVSRKEEKLKEIISDLECVAYIGDDLNDIPTMKLIKNNGGTVGCPQDAVDAVKKIVDYTCSKRAGEGAVREFAEWIIENCENEI